MFPHQPLGNNKIGKKEPFTYPFIVILSISGGMVAVTPTSVYDILSTWKVKVTNLVKIKKSGMYASKTTYGKR